MARVPYTPVPDITPQSPGEGISISTPGAAFGENIGNALQHLGTTTEQVGGEIFQRAIALQDLANETEARNKVIDFTTQAAQRQADFDSLQGVDAKNALPAHLKAIGDLRNSTRGTLSSPMAQRYFDQEASSFQNRITFSSAAHAGDQFKKYTMDTAQAQVDLTQKAYVDPFSEAERTQKNKTIEENSHTLAAGGGWSEAKRQDYVLTQTSKNRLGQIEQQAMLNPLKANDTLQAAIKAGEIDQAAADQARVRIFTQNRGVGVENQAKNIWSKDKTLEQMDVEAEKRSEDQSVSLGDPLFEKDLKIAIRRKSLADDAITRDQLHRNLGTVQDAINTGNYPTVQALLADPEIGPAIHALPGRVRDQLPEMVKEHFVKHNADEGYNNYQALYGDSQHNPTRFLDTNLYDPDLKLSKDQRNDLLRVRKTLVANPNANPQVTRAIRWMAQTHGQELAEFGVLHPPPRSADSQSDTVKNYNMYIGALSQAIEAFQQQYQHFPTPDEFDTKIAKPLLNAQLTNVGTFMNRGWFGQNKIPEFERPIEDKARTEAANALRDEATKQNINNYEPSESDIRMYIVRKQWDEFYKNAKASESGRAEP